MMGSSSSSSSPSSSSFSSSSSTSSSSRTHQYDHFTSASEIEDLDLPMKAGDTAPYLLDARSKKQKKKDSRSNAATGASAAGVRAFTAQAVAFYFRAPAKAFFRTRVDYLVFARSVVSQDAAAAATTTGKLGSVSSSVVRRVAWAQLWRNSTAGLLSHAVRTYGWRVIPEQVLPPLAANVAVGAILYTSYLQILGWLHEPSGESKQRVYPPPGFGATFTAGFLAGGIQSVVAAPLDALMVRYERRGAMNGHGTCGSAEHSQKTMVAYGREKLREIGVRGIFAGWTLSFAKDSLGSGVFFGVFEWTKAQGYYNFVRWYYGALRDDVVDIIARKRPDHRSPEVRREETKTIIKPHYALEPGFLMLAGIAATVVQQGILFPLTNVQQKHFERLEELDGQARAIAKTGTDERRRGRMLRAYVNAYSETLKECVTEASTAGGMKRWLFKGFWWSTVRQVPSTSAGLIIFELVRRKYGMDSDEVRISQDGYDILLK